MRTWLKPWLATVGALLWMYALAYSFEPILFESYVYMPVFMGLAALSMLVSGLLSPARITKAAAITTPIGAICTLVMYWLPLPGLLGCYFAAAILLGPFLVNSIYTLLMTAPANRRLTTYLSAVAATLAIQAVWILLPLEYTAKFPIIAFIVLGLSRLHKHTRTASTPLPQTTTGRRRNLLTAVSFFALLAGIDLIFQIILTNLVGFEEGEPSLWLLTWLLTATCAVGFALLADRNLERAGLSIGLSIALIGIMSSLLGTPTGLNVWLLIAYGFGGGFTLFFLISFPVHFMATSRHPALLGVVGVIFMLLRGMVMWPADLLFPQIMIPGGLPMAFFVITALAVVGLLLYSLLVLEYQAERNLAIALVRSVRPSSPEAHKDAPDSTASLQLPNLGDKERKVADLLIKGSSKGEIARKLHLTAAETAYRIENIRATLIEPQVSTAESLLRKIQTEYQLTMREGQILAGIWQGLSNAEIAAEHTITERTVKFHVSNLLKKLPASNRTQLRQWLVDQAHSE